MPHCPRCFRRLGPGAPCPTDGERVPLVEPPTDRPPEIPGHRPGELLGAGGHASVWAAEAAGGERAVKVAHAATDYARARFDAEAAALARLGPPFTPALHDTGILADGRPYLVIDRVPGASLGAELAAAPGPLPAARARRVAAAVLEALAFVHDRGVVHRDLSPDNVFLGDAGAVLVDFGVSRRPTTDAELTRTGWVIGTPLYMAPEQLRGDEVDERADLYAFGALLFECLTLRPPFVGDDATIERGHRLRRPPRPGDLAAVPIALEELCLACLAKDPAERPPGAEALRQRLLALPAAGPISAPRPQSTRLEQDRQPVVLLTVDDLTLDPAALGRVRGRRGAVVRHRRGGFTCAFFGVGDVDPAEAALASAAELIGAGASRAALHLAELKVRGGDADAPRVYGREVEQPRRWWPAEPWSGVILTARIAEVMAPGTCTAEGAPPGFFVPAEADEPFPEPPLVGRDDLMKAAGAAAAACARERSPVLVTIAGDRGSGKTRAALEVARIAAARWPRARTLALRCRRGDAAGATEALRSQLGCESAAGWQLGDALRRAAGELVVLVDDAHHGDDDLLDALEYASLDWPGACLFICVTADPALATRRPQWGTRAWRHERLELAPLSEEAATELASELLRPADYLPQDALRRLARWCGGNPYLLTELIRRLERDGAIVRKAGSQGWSLDPRRLDALPPSPAGQWLAARELDTLDADVAALARMCAVLGSDFTAAELAHLQAAAERAGTASSAVDTREGLRELARIGLLEERGDTWSFARPLVQEATYHLLRPEDRQALHRHAFELLRAGGDQRQLAAMARHGAACGRRAEAAAAYMQLGDRARAEHRYVDAELHYGSAAELSHDELDTVRALIGRGAVRPHIQRTREAIDDLRRAGALAAARGDDSLRAEALLEEATALDAAEEFAASARRAEEVSPLVEALGDPRLEVRLLNALGRARWRQEDPQGAAALLEESADRAAELGDHETRMPALLLLGCALVFADRIDDARARFDEAIDTARRAGDRLHLCAAYANRIFVWRADPSGAVGDLRQAVELARAIGNPALERVASHNLAELLYWSGDDDAALPLARRGRILQQRFSSAPVPDDALLLARICAVRGDHGEARKNLAWVNDTVPEDARAPSDRLFVRLLELACDDEAGERLSDWRALVDEAGESLAGEERLEVIYFTALRAPAALEGSAPAIDELLDRHPIWRKRFANTPAAGRR